MKIKLYSLNQIQHIINKKNGKKVDIKSLFNLPSAILIKNGVIYLTESLALKYVHRHELEKYRFIESDFENLLIISSYKKFVEKKKNYRHRSIIEHREKIYNDSKYVENTINYISEGNRIAAIDCEFNRDVITEIGILIYDKNKDEFETYHFCKKAFDCDGKSPFRNPFKLSLTKVYYVDDINEIIDIVDGILSGVDVLCGHAVKNDLDRLKNYGLKILNKIIIDTQKIYQKLNNEQISLGSAIEHYCGLFFELFTEKEISNKVNQIKNMYQGTHPNFINSNLIENIFIHNAFNDAVIAFLLLENMLNLEMNYSFVSADSQKMLENKLIVNYNGNLFNFIDYAKKGN